jgi:hypothetical protein
MIRPITIATFLMACGSGLYLYQSKHEVQLLDRTIERTVRETSVLREQSRLLVAEWTMLNDPERLRQFSDTYLSLRSISPSQFSSLSDLDNRLPAPHVEPPINPVDPANAPVASAGDVPGAVAPSSEPDGAIVAEEVLPVPPRPTAPPSISTVAVASAPRPAAPKSQAPRLPVAEVAPQRVVPTADIRSFDQRSFEQHRPRSADVRPPEAKPVELHAMVAPRPVPVPAPVPVLAPRPVPANPPPAKVVAATPYGGSLLGMARGSMPPAPRPMPVNATQWYNTN